MSVRFRITTIKGHLRLWSLLAILILVLASLAAYAVTESYQVRAVYRSQLEAEQQLKASITEEWLRTHIADLRSLSQMESVRQQDLERIQALLQVTYQHSQDYYSIHFIDTNGLVRASTEPLSTFDGLDARDREYFQRAIRGEEHLSEPLIGKASGIPTLFFSTPVYGMNQDIIGLVTGTFDLSAIDRLLRAHQTSPSFTTYIVDKQGKLIAHTAKPDSVGEAIKRNTVVKTDILRQLDSGNPPELSHVYDGFEGYPVYGVARALWGGQWLAVTEIKRSLVLTQVAQQVLHLGLIMIGILVLFFMIFNRILERKLSRPILDLLRGARTIGLRQYAYRIPRAPFQRVPQEFLALSEAFNQMSRTVEEHVHSIETANQRYINVLESISDAFITLDSAWRFTYINRKAESLMYVSRSQLINRCLWEELPQLKDSVFETEFHLAMASREHVSICGELNNKCYEVRVFPYEDGISIYFHDITERVAADLALRENEEKYRFLAENATDMISIHDRQGVFTYVSSLGANLYGFAAESLLGTCLFDYIHPDDQEASRKHHQLVISDDDIHVFVCRLLLADGRTLWIETRSKSVHSSDRAGRIISVTRDITERKQAEFTLLETNAKLQQMSELDSLTHIANRRRFDQELLREWKRAARFSAPLSLIMLDIDYFKYYNDTYGHLGGDHCLRRVAETLSAGLHRPGDFVARYGGEEFVVILPDTDLTGAEIVAEQLRAKIEVLELAHESSRVSPFVTISLGVACMTPRSTEDPLVLVDRADRALYQAKQTRNHVSVYISGD